MPFVVHRRRQCGFCLRDVPIPGRAAGWFEVRTYCNRRDDLAAAGAAIPEKPLASTIAGRDVETARDALRSEIRELDKMDRA